MSYKYWVAFCVAVFVSTISAVPVSGNNQEMRAALEKHQKRVREFKCATPQERSYKITKLLSVGEVPTTDGVFPLYTVIRTCDEGAGCCGTEEKICAPVAVESEEVAIKVSNFVNSTGTLRILRIEHHKECKCQLRTEVQNSSLTPKVTFIN